MMVYFIFKFLRIWSLFALVTVLFSVLVMMSCHNIFKHTGKNPIYAFYPIYNLLILLDVAKMDRVYFILLLLPIVNVLTIYLILYRLSIVFRTKSGFAFGLILLCPIFLPILNYSNMCVIEEKKEIKDDVSENMVTMLTQEQYDNLNKIEEETPKVDNVFKIKIKEEEPTPIFKANKIKYREMVLDNEETKKIEKVEPVVITQEIKTNKFVNEKVIEEDDSIEIVEL